MTRQQKTRRTAFEMQPELREKLAQLAEDVDRRVHPRTTLRLAAAAKRAGLDRKTVDNLRYNRHSGPPEPETLVRLYRDGFAVSAKEGARLLAMFGYPTNLWDAIPSIAIRHSPQEQLGGMSAQELTELAARLLHTQEQLRQAQAEIRRLRRSRSG